MEGNANWRGLVCTFSLNEYLMPLDTECELLCHLCRETLPEPERHFHLQRVAPEDQETEQSHYVKDVLMQEITIILKWVHRS